MKYGSVGADFYPAHFTGVSSHGMKGISPYGQFTRTANLRFFKTDYLPGFVPDGRLTIIIHKEKQRIPSQGTAECFWEGEAPTEPYYGFSN